MVRLQACFPGDEYGWVIRMQQEELWERVKALRHSLFSACRNAERLLDVDTRLGDLVAEGEPVSYVPLIAWYASVAAEFRYARAEQMAQPELPGLLDRCSHQERIKRRWDAYIQRDVCEIVSAHPDMVRRMLLAMLRPEPEPEGSEAAAWLALNDAARLDHYQVRTGPAYRCIPFEIPL